MRPIILFLLLFLTGMLSAQQTLKVSNIAPRTDVNGRMVDAHDGRVIQFGNTYYWYGTSYGDTGGFTPANHYVAYASNDLQSWRYLGKLLPDAPEGSGELFGPFEIDQALDLERGAGRRESP